MGLETIALSALIASSIGTTATSVRSARTQRKATESAAEKTEIAQTKATAEEAKLKEQTAQRKIKRRGAAGLAERTTGRDTILTGPLGLTDGAGAGTRKTLLGE